MSNLPYAGYRRPEAPETRRLEALTKGYLRLWGMCIFIGPIVPLTTRHFGTTHTGLWGTVAVSLITGCYALWTFESVARGLLWGRIFAVFLALLLASNGLIWSSIGLSRGWIFNGSWVVAASLILLPLWRVETELKRFGFKRRRAGILDVAAQLKEFGAARRETDARPPAPENLLSGEGPR